jgi:hypothetical protein
VADGTPQRRLRIRRFPRRLAAITMHHGSRVRPRSTSVIASLGLFAEFDNLTNRANFGNIMGGNQVAPLTYGKPTGYLGGIGAVSTIPNS